MKMKNRHKGITSWILAVVLAGAVNVQAHAQKNDQPPAVASIKIVLDAAQKHQTIDGFGANVTPAQWRDGNLKPTIDLLVDDLGSTLIRFDCYGRADWLDPKMMQSDGTFPKEYLKSVYTSPVFRDAWEMFRYFNSKGVQPIFNVSGAIPWEWAEKDGESRRLVNFDAYAEMAASLLLWARNEEKLKFSLFMPFNEPDFARVEGPRIPNENCVPATRAVIERLKANGLGDVKVLVMDDSYPIIERMAEFLKTPELKPGIYGFSMHSYGDGLYGEVSSGWYTIASPFKKIADAIDGSNVYKGSPMWLTEYGDLDQTELFEKNAAWLSARRLLLFLNDGGAGALTWDAYDNYHLHDETWAYYGLFKTHQETWTYTPKPRYFAVKQVYKFVRPGFQRVDAFVDYPNKKHVYAQYMNPGRHLLLSGYVSPDGREVTLVGMNHLEASAALELDLKGVAPEVGQKQVNYYRTSETEHCRLIESIPVENGHLKITVPAHTIFTLTTLK